MAPLASPNLLRTGGRCGSESAVVSRQFVASLEATALLRTKRKGLVALCAALRA